MENVPEVVGRKNEDSFYKWCSFLESNGYQSKWQILNAKDYKVPQNRERCFMVSWIGDYYYDFPKTHPLEKVLRDILLDDSEVGEKYYLSEKGVQYVMRREGTYTHVLGNEDDFARTAITAKGNNNWTGNFIKAEPVLVGGYGEMKSNNGTQWYQQDRVYSADAVAMAHCSQIPSGSYSYYTGETDRSNCHQVGTLQGGKWDKMHESSRRVYSVDAVSPTVTTVVSGNSEIKVFDMYNAREVDRDVCGTITSSSSHNGSGTFCVQKPKSPIRKLTQKECWRLMDFDDEDYEKARKALNEKFYKGNDRSGSQLYKQAGNSIVVNCLVEIIRQMI